MPPLLVNGGVIITLVIVTFEVTLFIAMQVITWYSRGSLWSCGGGVWGWPTGVDISELQPWPHHHLLALKCWVYQFMLWTSKPTATKWGEDYKSKVCFNSKCLLHLGIGHFPLSSGFYRNSGSTNKPEKDNCAHHLTDTKTLLKNQFDIWQEWGQNKYFFHLFMYSFTHSFNKCLLSTHIVCLHCSR